MKPLIIKSDPNTLEINFNAQTGTLELAGKSMPENAKLFFGELTTWIENYVQTNPSKTTVNVKITYLNSGSHGYIADLFKRFQPLYKSGKEINIKWYYESDDRELQEIGKECSEIAQIPFELVPVDSF